MLDYVDYEKTPLKFIDLKDTTAPKPDGMKGNALSPMI